MIKSNERECYETENVRSADGGRIKIKLRFKNMILLYVNVEHRLTSWLINKLIQHVHVMRERERY